MPNFLVRVLNFSIDALSNKEIFRKLVNYAATRINGFQYGSYSLNDEVNLAQSFVEAGKNSVVVDGGANRGDWSRRLVEAGYSGCIVAVEPNPIHRDCLLKLSGHLIYEPVALGKDHSTMSLYYDDEGSTFASLYRRDLSHHGLDFGREVKVVVDTIDSVLERNSIDRVDFLKLDLEGHELAALGGAKKAFAQAKIRALVFEVGGANIDSQTWFRDFYKFLVKENGFFLFRILPGRRLLRISKYSEECERFSWQNILACAPGVSPVWEIIE